MVMVNGQPHNGSRAACLVQLDGGVAGCQHAVRDVLQQLQELCVSYHAVNCMAGTGEHT